MTKADLIRQIADETGVERVDVAQSVEAPHRCCQEITQRRAEYLYARFW